MNVEYERIWVDGMNRGDLSAADSAFAPSCVIHLTGIPEPISGIRALKETVQGFLTAFPDLHFTIEDQFVMADRVAIRWRARGTHLRPLGPLPATGRTMEIDGVIMDRVENGKVVERWEQFDQTRMLQQLGVA